MIAADVALPSRIWALMCPILPDAVPRSPVGPAAGREGRADARGMYQLRHITGGDLDSTVEQTVE
ncbi:hypothetical protein GCM10009716_15710 [Streptomyces sodiiphilus]|uniref:Uncharacterized protein n=1 Tax=Streptomyces sodiiphilus TaxID=226217 RepID=A0ABN2P065_9ACTN